jgi:hypothetical protein
VLKITGVCFLFLICFQPAIAQHFHAGVIGGLATTQVAGDQLSGFNKAGVIVGGFANAPLTDKSSFQMEIIFIQKGSRKPVEPDNNNEYYVLRLSYIEVPLLYKYQATPKINVEIGPSFGVLIFSEEEREWGKYQPDPPFNNYEFSGNVGLSYSLSEKLCVNARFNTSILTIRPWVQNTYDPFFDKGQYNTVVAFTLHYQF